MGHQQHPIGAAGHEGEGGERIECIVTTGLQPLVGRGRVVGEPMPSKPAASAVSAKPDQPVAVHQVGGGRVAHDRIGDPVLHVLLPSVGPVASVNRLGHRQPRSRRRW